MEEHECLKCGWCCEVPDVDLEDEGIKPMRERCHHLTQVVIKDGLFVPASCDIHDDKPLDCSFSPSDGPCEIGLLRWKNKKDSRPEVDLPERVREVLNDDSRKAI